MLQIKRRVSRSAPVCAIALAGASALALTAGQAWAQTAIEEVVVTAERRETRLQDTPIAITAFTEQALEARAITNVSDLTRFTPNAVITSTNRPAGGSASIAAYIRGVGAGDYLFPLEPGVGVYIDGVYLAKTAGGLMDIVDIERIEVLKGPQGTLFGRNTVGGAISIVTKRPIVEGEADVSAEVRLGNYNRKDLLGSISAPLKEGVLGAKIGFGTFHQDGYGLQINSGNVPGAINRTVVRAALAYEPTDDLQVLLSFDKSRQRNNGRPTYTYRDQIVATYQRYNQIAVPVLNQQLGLPPGTVIDFRFNSPGPFSSYGERDSNPRDDYDIAGVALDVNYSLNEDWAFRSITALREVETFTGGGNAAAVPYPILGGVDKGESIYDRQISQEFQLSGTAWDGRLTVLVGAYGFYEEGKRRTASNSFHGIYEVTRNPNDARDTITFNSYDAKSYSLFTQETLKLTDSFDITVGARYTIDEKSLFQYSIFDQINRYQVPPRGYDDTWEKFTPKVGLNWRPREDLLVYASYSEGYKSGGWSPNGTNPIIPDPAFQPETLTAYEVGFKSQWFDRRVTLNGAAFYNEYKDIQLTAQIPDPASGVNLRTTQNAGDAELHGFELELQAVPVDNLNIQAGVGYVHNEFTRLTPGARAAGTRLTDKLASVPEWTVNLAATYTVPLSFGELSFHGNAAYRSDILLTMSDPLSFQDDLTLYGGRISFEPARYPGLSVSLVGANLSDEYYFTYAAYQATGGQFIANVAQPRTYYLSLKYEF